MLDLIGHNLNAMTHYNALWLTQSRLDGWTHGGANENTKLRRVVAVRQSGAPFSVFGRAITKRLGLRMFDFDLGRLSS